VIIPLVLRLHYYGVWEVFVHFVGFLLQAQAARMAANSGEATAHAWMATGAPAYVALSALVLKEVALRYSPLKSSSTLH
jgi:hypothetical protein